MRHLVLLSSLPLVLLFGCVAFTDLDQVEEDNQPGNGRGGQPLPTCAFAMADIRGQGPPFECGTEPLTDGIFDLARIDTCVIDLEDGTKPFYADVCDDDYEVMVTIDQELAGAFDVDEGSIEADFTVEWEFYGAELEDCEPDDPRDFSSCNELQTALNLGEVGLSPWRGDWGCGEVDDEGVACSCTTTSSPPFEIDYDIAQIAETDRYLELAGNNEDPNVEVINRNFTLCRPNADTIEVYGILNMGENSVVGDSRGIVFIGMRFQR